MPRRVESEPDQQGGFEFTYLENLSAVVGDKRFHALLNDPDTTIHKITVDENSYGEFIFVYCSRPQGDDRQYITFYGQGFHHYREEWLVDEWRWYGATPSKQTKMQSLDKDVVREKLAERANYVEREMTDNAPSERALLYALIADLTDDDSAIVELDDLENLGWRFDDEADLDDETTKS